MAMIHMPHSRATFNGGNYTQVNHISQQGHQSLPWDLLQSAVAPSAFHNSDDDFDAPQCHPNTRVAVMDELRDFVFQRGDTAPAKLLWLSGPAGAGKSAIARSLCEECSVTNFLLASFFFNRSDASRNTHKSFVATVTYQIWSRIPSQSQSLILDVLEQDPLIFTRSVDAQFQALIVAPLHGLFENGYFDTIERRLIVIDGLDECSTIRAQINILSVIHKVSNRADIPFIFLIASRPENEIQAFFRSPSMVPFLHRLHLSRFYNPDKDIERFLRDKLQETCDTHPFKDSIPCEWPSSKDIQTLVRKSSGQFIYASLVVRYVTSNRHYPPKRLDVILKLRPPRGDLPFAELDALYSHIFSRVENIDLALLIIGYVISDKISPSIEELARIDQLDPDDCLAALCDLYSVLSISTNSYSGERYVHISHKSLSEYLCDGTRSEKYHINTIHVLTKRAAKCMQYISGVVYTPESLMTRYNIMAFFHRHIRRLINNIPLSYEAIMSFSLTKCYDTFSSPNARSKEESALFVEIFWDNLFFSLLDHLRNLVGTDYVYLYDHHLGEFRKLINRHPDLYMQSLTKFKVERVAALMTVHMLTEPSGAAVPLKMFASMASAPLSISELGKHPCWFSFGRLGNLFHDGALRCFEYLKHDIDPSSVAANLRYLTWVLPYAAQSPELEAACNPREPFAYATTGSRDPGLYNLTQQATAAMQAYQEKLVEAQHLWFPYFDDNTISDDGASQSNFMDNNVD